MIITKDFIILNYPKTGSSFVRKVIKEIHKDRQRKSDLMNRIKYLLKVTPPEIKELILPNIKMPNTHADQHGTVTQIPKEHCDKPIVSVVRNPYSRFLSTYQFRWWRIYPHVDKEVLEGKFPSFPELTLDQYCDFDAVSVERRIKTVYGDNNVTNEKGIGNQTVLFVQMFFKDPKKGLSSLSDEYISSGAYKKDMGNIHLLRQENLNEELIGFLKKYGYSEEEFDIIRNFERVNVTKSQVAKPQDLWTEKAINHVKHRERYLLQIFDDLNMHYHPPGIQTVNSLS